MRTGSPYREATLARDFADVRDLAFPADTPRLMDMRRSGVVEAIAGGTDAVALSAELANSIGRSNALHKTYAPVEIEAVRKADAARFRGRRDASRSAVRHRVSGFSGGAKRGSSVRLWSGAGQESGRAERHSDA
jgi:hypothetical protein